MSKTIEIGTRIGYNGDIANRPGRGVIVELSDTARIILDDGRDTLINVRHIKTSDEAVLSDRFIALDENIADFEERAELIVRAAIKKAIDDENAKAAKDARVKLIERLKTSPEFAHFEQGNDPYSGKLAVRNIRKELKKEFGEIKFSVRNPNYGTIKITYPKNSGIELSDIENVTAKFKRGYFDGRQDIYEDVKPAFCEVFGGADYIFTQEDF